MAPSYSERIPPGVVIPGRVAGESSSLFMDVFALPLDAHLPPPADPETVQRIERRLTAAFPGSPQTAGQSEPRLGERSPGGAEQGPQGSQAAQQASRQHQRSPGTARGRPRAQDNLTVPPAVLHSVASALARGIGAAIAVASGTGGTHRR